MQARSYLVFHWLVLDWVECQGGRTLTSVAVASGAVRDLTGAEAQPEDASSMDGDVDACLPTAIDPEALRTCFTLTTDDFSELAQCRAASNKLGFSAQLCALRWRGHFLADLREVPAPVLDMLAPQLGILPMPLTDYPQDDLRRARPTSSAFASTWVCWPT